LPRRSLNCRPRVLSASAHTARPRAPIIATNLSIERVRWAAQGESRHYRAARPVAGSKVFERLDLSSTCHIACHSAVELQAHSAGQKTGASSAGRHDRIPAATIFIEGVKSASIPQWTTLDVSPLRKGPQQLSHSSFPAHGQMPWPCVADPKHLLSIRPVRSRESHARCVSGLPVNTFGGNSSTKEKLHTYKAKTAEKNRCSETIVTF